jgi:uroporphyrinogen III methyltransferase/synthase
VPFEVVPGVTAGIGACAYAGIPVTHRGIASAVALVTGHEDPGKEGSTIDYEALARFPGTLVLYMGVSRLERIASSLIAAGRPADEPAAVIESGTLPWQRTLTSTLAQLAGVAEDGGVEAPAIVVVGPVAALAQEISWLEPRPLKGLTVAVTRAREQASELAGRLERLGARVLEAPVIRVQPLTLEPLDPQGYDLVCLTSANGVRLLFERLAAGGRDARSLAHARIAVIGPATARALAEHGIAADVVAERFLAEGLVQALEAVPARRALLARARGARDVLPEALRERGIEVDVLELYETVAEPLSAQALRVAREADYITFTSSSTVRFFLDASARAAGDTGVPGPALDERTRIVSIGPVTSAALREHDLEPHVEAARHDIEGLVAALLADAAAAFASGAGAGGS